ncbi:hypothetical protein PASE110613_05095 [Paenibacillus sediminis]|uniref:Uncharacterized lipoprotein YehR (DUF1307 family) n=1 Tax=Paenibacillus sediminis TaxID=664909 RepID=A0ABS4H0U8_9BACL|nr:hypothetical protein [Paenibacillus sediminis]MBP1936150.1 uncharacterized lipoprotein YehR (DUF1307 family) [Paenibacillus sediminis]
MKINKKTLSIAAVIILAISITACSKDEKPEVKTTPSNNVIEDNNTAKDNGQNNEQDNQQQQPEETKSEIKQGSGIYVGQIDSHSIEIQTSEGSTAFQLEGETVDLSNIKEKDNVQFEYYEKTTTSGVNTVKQLFITKIEKQAADQQSMSLPKTMDIKLTIEGNEETREAKLAESNDYYLYVLPGFTFKEDKLMMNYDNNYYAELELLPKDYDLDTLKKDAESTLKKVGEVHELKGVEIMQSMRDAKLFLLASSTKLTKEVIIKEFNGRAFRITVNMPVGEASEGFGPSAFASLNTIGMK